MKLFIIWSLIMFGVGALLAGVYFDHRIDVLLQREQLKTHNAYYNLNYEIMAHEQDVGLLKKENHTLQQSCEP